MSNRTTTRIQFVSEIKGFRLGKKPMLKKWIHTCAAKEKKKIGNLCFVFCDDAFLYPLNLQYLKHKTLTDILTFDYSEKPGEVSGEIFISTERVKENAADYGTGFDTELHRVMIHGVLHLMGYRDKTAAEKNRMRKKKIFIYI